VNKDCHYYQVGYLLFLYQTEL